VWSGRVRCRAHSHTGCWPAQSSSGLVACCWCCPAPCRCFCSGPPSQKVSPQTSLHPSLHLEQSLLAECPCWHQLPSLLRPRLHLALQPRHHCRQRPSCPHLPRPHCCWQMRGPCWQHGRGRRAGRRAPPRGWTCRWR
jgi:hypothetical protein